MIPTLVIGLREGVEASLIVGIIAAFLRRNGRRDALRQMWIGVLAAVALCLVIGVGLVTASRELPQQAQEGLETVIGAFAVVMVTFMIVWMTKHARGMKKELEGAAADALDRGSAAQLVGAATRRRSSAAQLVGAATRRRSSAAQLVGAATRRRSSAAQLVGAATRRRSSAGALVVMAFLAVLREGFETAVFLVSVIQNSSTVATGTVGAVLGILGALVIGYGIYRGGIRLNLGRFFKVTGLVLVLVAAGLVMTVLHTAHETGWVNVGQAQAVDLNWLVRPGTVLASLLTGVLGLQPRPTVVEAIGWLAFAVPMLVFVGWPPGRRPAASPSTPAATAGRDSRVSA